MGGGGFAPKMAQGPELVLRGKAADPEKGGLSVRFLCLCCVCVDCTFHGTGSPSGLSPPATSGTGLLSYGCRTCPYPGYPLSPPLPLAGGNGQRVYISNQSPFI